MTLDAECRVGFAVVVAVFGDASAVVEHESDLALGALVAVVTDASCDFCHAFVVRVELVPSPAGNTDVLGAELQASRPAQPQDIIVPRTALRAHNLIEIAAVINNTQPIGIELIPSHTRQTLPRRCAEIPTLIRDTSFIDQLILYITLQAPIVEVIKRRAVVHVTETGQWVEEVPGDALGAGVVLVGVGAVFQLAGVVGGQLEASLALQAFADVGGAVGCAVLGNAGS